MGNAWPEAGWFTENCESIRTNGIWARCKVCVRNCRLRRANESEEESGRTSWTCRVGGDAKRASFHCQAVIYRAVIKLTFGQSELSLHLTGRRCTESAWKSILATHFKGDRKKRSEHKSENEQERWRTLFATVWPLWPLFANCVKWASGLIWRPLSNSIDGHTIWWVKPYAGADWWWQKSSFCFHN